MSCFIVRDETLLIISDFITYLRCQKTPIISVDAEWPFSCTANSEVFSTKIYEDLFKLNAEALICRYGNEVDPPKIPPYIPIRSGLNFENFVSWYMVVKALDCYLYQVSEGNIPEGEIYKYLVELQKELALYIVKKNKYYDVYTWG